MSHGLAATPGLRNLLACLLYVVVATLALGVNPLRNETTTPFDVLVSQRAWSFVDPGVQVRNYERSDILNSRLPQWEVARKQIRNGHFPLWNDKIAGGGTFLTVNSNLFTPAFAIFAAAPDPAFGFYLGMLFNLTAAGLGMHLFLRRHLGWLASITGAITFELCGFNAAWLYWPHVFTVIWAPWLLWAIDRCASLPGIRNSLLVAVFSGLVCLGGFPFLSILVLEAGALYALVLLITKLRSRDDRFKFAAWYAAGTVLGLALAALPLLGLFHWLKQFDIGYRYGRGSYLNLQHVRQLFPPWAYQNHRVEQTMYVGAAVLALAAASLLWIASRWRRPSPLSVFALLLLVISSGLVFGLWPSWLVEWLPGMAYNSWSRSICLLSIALISLGVLCLDGLWHAYGRRFVAVRVLLITIACLQVLEMSLFFRSYNGSVDAAYYYPSTPTIEYVRREAGPFDYVITDKSFLMSGTLGAYGLREWLAHYFRSPALQLALHQMAKRPFNSHRASASRFPPSDINYDSAVMADYNIRFALVDSRWNPGSRAPVEPTPTGKHQILPPMPNHRYFQVFRAPEGRLIGISVRFATYTRSALPGRVDLVLFDATGKRVASQSIDAATIIDNQMTEFGLQEPVELGEGDCGFELTYRPDGSALPLTVWSFSGNGTHAGLAVDGNPHPGTIQYQLHTERKEEGQFRTAFRASGTAVLENKASPRGPYFIRVLEAHASPASARNIAVLDYRPNAFTLEYKGDLPGFVVVPMSYNPDWQVRVNGVPTAPAIKNGVMPAIYVDSSSVINFEYHPWVLRWLMPWIVALAAILGIMLVADRQWQATRR